MTEPENLILHKLAEMRAETAARDEKMQAQIGILAKGQVDVRAELKEIRNGMDRINTHMHEIAIAIDHHGTRLDGIETRLERVEKHLGLEESKH